MRLHWSESGIRMARMLAIVAGLGLLGGCSSIDGYAGDPLPPTALADLQRDYFSADASAVHDYNGATTEAARRPLRDRIVYARMHAYDIEFTAFVRELSAGNNAFSVGTDFAALALNGLGATTGNAATKAALAAASGGVLAANGAVNKDLFYQKTVPALVAQMEADRQKAQAAILDGLKLADADYPLPRAVLDLDRLNDAGSLNSAIATITQHAADSKTATQALIDANRISAYHEDAVSGRIWTWLFPGATASANGTMMNGAVPATADATRLSSLRSWMKQNGLDSLATQKFLDGEAFASLRAQAATALQIP